MFINLETNVVTEEQVAGSLPFICVDPVNLENYTIHSDPDVTIFNDRVEYTYYHPKNISTTKKQIELQIKNELDDVLNGGFEYNGEIYDSDATSLFRILSLYTFANANPEFASTWIVKNNSVVFLSNTDIKQVSTTAMVFQSQHITQSRIKKDLVNACTTLEELSALGY